MQKRSKSVKISESYRKFKGGNFLGTQCIFYYVILKICYTVKPVFFACPLFHEFREPGKFAKITGRENLNTVAFQCSKKQKR